MKAYWEGPSVGLFQQNRLVLLHVAVTELNVLSGMGLA